MRLRFFVSIGAFFLIVGMIFAIVLINPRLTFSISTNNGQSTPDATVSVASNEIMRENAQLGTTKWEIPLDNQAYNQIQAYTSATSVSPGEKITFYVSTQVEGIHLFMEIYRLGWYGGDGGRLMTSPSGLIGHAQGYYDTSAHNLVNCSSCYINRSIGLVEANWKSSYSLIIPSDWTTGVYLAKFTDINGKETYASFDVRGNPHSEYLIVTSDNTYEAYNDWGGYSLYEADNAAQSSENTPLPRGMEVSFDRPYLDGQGSGQVLTFEINAIRWLERQGYDLSYISSVDLHENPGQLLQHRAYLSIGHDEYWSKEMRDGVENARDHGVGLAFLGANASYWQIRYATDSAGVPDRRIICYKVATANHDLTSDPLYGKDNSRVTSQWRDPVVGRPENALIGIMFSDLTHQRRGYAWQVSTQAKSPLFDGTGLRPGQKYGCDLVGYEWDRIFANGDTPADLQVLSQSPIRNDTNKADFSDTTYYIASSGAMVFATGSIYWDYALDAYRLTPDPQCANQDPVVPGMQRLMANMMKALVTHFAPGKLVVSPSVFQSHSPLFPILHPLIAMMDLRRPGSQSELECRQG